MNKLPYRPTTKGFREPTDNNRRNGRILNPPRLNQMGGLDKLHEPNGLRKNDLSIRKPGDTTSPSVSGA